MSSINIACILVCLSLCVQLYVTGKICHVIASMNLMLREIMRVQHDQYLLIAGRKPDEDSTPN